MKCSKFERDLIIQLASAQTEIEFLTKALEQAIHLSRMEIDRESDVICFDNDWNSQPNVPELAEYLKRRESNIEAGEGESFSGGSPT